MSCTFRRHILGRLLAGFALLTPCLRPAFAQSPPPEYPRTVLYQGVLHPLVTFGNEAPVFNFKTYYLVGFPVGVNTWKSSRLGYSLEIVPFIRSENGISRVSNVLFHPGVLLGLGKGYTLAGRLAFETAGRYGITPVLNKIVKRSAQTSYFVAIPLPVRFGNDRPAGVTIAFQFGIAF